jgi:hypothetical protein
MKTRRRSKTENKVLTRKNSLSPQIINLISIYWDLVVEYQTKQNRFKNTFKQCLKWKQTLPTFFALYPKAFPVLDNNNVSRLNNPIFVINKSIQDLKTDLLVVHNELLHVNSICEVQYRTKYNILHTLPKKKIPYIQQFYPDINKRMAISRAKIKKKRCVNTYNKPKKVRFGTKQIRHFNS